MPPKSTAPAGAQQCEECEDVVATRSCEECKQVQCTSCDEKFHKPPAKRSKHVRVDLKTGAKISSLAPGKTAATPTAAAAPAKGGDDDDDDLAEFAGAASDSKASHSLLKEGILKKKSPKGFLKVWQPRYFKLFSDGLHYFKDKKAVEPQGMVPLFAITAIEIPAGKSKDGDRFDVCVGDTKKDKKAGGRVFSLRADNAAECAKWVELLQKLLSDAAADARRAGARANAPVSASAGSDGKFWKDQNKLADMKLKQSTQKVEVKTGVFDKEKPLEIKLDIKLLKEETASVYGSTYRGQDHPRSGGAIAGLGLQSYLVHASPKDASELKTIRQLHDDMSQLSHAYIARQLERGEAADHIYAIYAPVFSPEDSLVSYLEVHRRFPADVVRFLCQQISLAVGYLHSKGLTFFNLQPDNIFIDADGHACLLHPLLALPHDKILSESRVSEYAVPERIESPAADWWRLGVMLYELSVGMPPFRSREKGQARDEDIARQIAEFQPDKLRFPPFVTGELKELIKGFLTPDPSQRLGGRGRDVLEIKEHAFFVADDMVSWDDQSAARGAMADRTPSWIKEKVAGPAKHGRLRNMRNYPVTYSRTLSVEVMAARNLPTPLRPAFCNLICEHRSQSTKPKASDNGAPDWGAEKFTWDVQADPEQGGAGEVVLELFQEPKKSSEEPSLVGQVTIGVADIQNAYPGNVDLWQSLFDPTSGMPKGEVHVIYQWDQSRVDMLPPRYITQDIATVEFFEHFGQPVRKKAKVVTLDVPSDAVRSSDDGKVAALSDSTDSVTLSSPPAHARNDSSASQSPAGTPGGGITSPLSGQVDNSDDEQAASDSDDDDTHRKKRSSSSAKKHAPAVAAVVSNGDDTSADNDGEEQKRLKAEARALFEKQQAEEAVIAAEEAARIAAEAAAEEEARRQADEAQREAEEAEAAETARQAQVALQAVDDAATAEAAAIAAAAVTAADAEAEKAAADAEIARVAAEALAAEEAAEREREAEKLRVAEEKRRRDADEKERKRRELVERERAALAAEAAAEEARRKKEEDEEERRRKDEEDEENARLTELQRIRDEARKALEAERAKLAEERKKLEDDRRRYEEERRRKLMEVEKAKLDAERRAIEEERARYETERAAQEAETERLQQEMARLESEKQAAKLAHEREAAEKARLEAQRAAAKLAEERANIERQRLAADRAAREAEQRRLEEARRAAEAEAARVAAEAERAAREAEEEASRVAAEAAAAATREAEAKEKAERERQERAAASAAKKAIADRAAAERKATADAKAAALAAAEKKAQEEAKAAEQKAAAEKEAAEKELAAKAAAADEKKKKAAADARAASEKLAADKAAAAAASAARPVGAAGPAWKPGGGCTDCDCSKFTPHAFKKTQCTSCFHEHSPPVVASSSSSSAGTTSSAPVKVAAVTRVAPVAATPSVERAKSSVGATSTSTATPPMQRAQSTIAASSATSSASSDNHGGVVAAANETLMTTSFAYKALKPEQMSYAKGALLLVTQVSGKNWWQARNTLTGESGTVAASYVKAAAAGTVVPAAAPSSSSSSVPSLPSSLPPSLPKTLPPSSSAPKAEVKANATTPAKVEAKVATPIVPAKAAVPSSPAPATTTTTAAAAAAATAAASSSVSSSVVQVICPTSGCECKTFKAGPFKKHQCSTCFHTHTNA